MGRLFRYGDDSELVIMPPLPTVGNPRPSEGVRPAIRPHTPSLVVAPVEITVSGTYRRRRIVERAATWKATAGSTQQGARRPRPILATSQPQTVLHRRSMKPLRLSRTVRHASLGPAATRTPHRKAQQPSVWKRCAAFPLLRTHNGPHVIPRALLDDQGRKKHATACAGIG